MPDEGRIVATGLQGVDVRTWISGGKKELYRIWHEDGGIRMINTATGLEQVYFPDQVRALFKPILQTAEAYLKEGTGGYGEMAAWTRDRGRADLKLARILADMIKQAEAHGDPTKNFRVLEDTKVSAAVHVTSIGG